jgi:hypothetical protein
MAGWWRGQGGAWRSRRWRGGGGRRPPSARLDAGSGGSWLPARRDAGLTLSRRGVSIVAVISGMLAVSCAPQTSLTGAAAAGAGSGSTGPGPPVPPVAVLLDPVPGALDVPPNLAGLTLRGPNGLGGSVEPPFRLTAVAPSSLPAVPLGASAPIDCADGAPGACVFVPLAEALVPATLYLASLSEGLIDDAGGPIRAGPIGMFTTAAAPDRTAPVLSGLSVALAGPCVVVAFQTDEPAAGRIVLAPDDPTRTRVVSVGRGATVFMGAAELGDVPPGSGFAVVAEATDLAGNLTESAAVELDRPASVVPIALTEIHANPAGPEPAQEYVELKNVGGAAVDLGGLELEDGGGADVLPSFVLAPGAYALVVPSGFDPASPRDTPPAAGTGLVRVDARLGGDGLANGGEALRLRAADGALISSYGSATPTATAAWSGKSIHRIPEDACDQPATWTTAPRPATPGWGPP